MSTYGHYLNKSSQKERRKNLRSDQTKAEAVLWSKIRRKQLGVKFRRQYNIDYYIVDFYCHELRLVIELDGYIHGEEEQKTKDKKRQNYLEQKGYKVIRYRNEQIRYELDDVLQDIINQITKLNSLKTPPNLPL